MRRKCKCRWWCHTHIQVGEEATVLCTHSYWGHRKNKAGQVVAVLW